jgi:hypothetical protein
MSDFDKAIEELTEGGSPKINGIVFEGVGKAGISSSHYIGVHNLTIQETYSTTRSSAAKISTLHRRQLAHLNSSSLPPAPS